MAVPPPVEELFSNAKTPLELVTKFETYQDQLNKSFRNPVSVSSATTGGPVGQLRQAITDIELSKSADARTLASLRQSLDNLDIGKDLNLAGPGSTGGLQMFDLSGPALQLSPRMTPLRNRIPRRRGIGTSHRFKRITGWSNSGTGGVADLWPGITETGTNVVAGQTLRRGPVITLAGDQVSVPYMTFSESNTVTWEAEFAGFGYQDLRQLSTTSLLYSSMVAEEKMLIESRGTTSPFLGGLGAPTGVAVSCAAPGTGQSATTGVTSKVWAFVTAFTRWGETPISSSGNGSWTSGQLATVSWTAVTGAYQYRIYVGTGSSDPGAAAYWLAGTTSGTSFAVQGALPTSGTAASTVNVSDSTAQATGYDGILATVLGPHSARVEHVNGPLSTNAGVEIQRVCEAIFDNLKGDPDTVVMNGYDRSQLSDLLKNNSSSNYRLQIQQSEVGDATIGALTTGIVNQVTGKMIDLTMNPWWPQGTAAVMSWAMPIPDSNVSEIWAVIGPQDFMSVEWPQVQFSYDSSSYWQNALVCFVPEMNGAITGITRV